MAFELFQLYGSIFVDNEKAMKSISKTEKGAETLGKKLGDGIKTAGKWGLALGAAGAAAGGALLAVADKAADTTDRIDKMSQKLGMSRQGFQEWDYILSQNGVSIDSMGSGMKTLTNQLDELSKGGKVATDAFSELGLSYDDLAGKSQEEVFEITVQALQSMEDETKRAAIANDLLGRSGQELAPLLNAGAESVEDLKAKAHELGIVLEDDAIDAGVKFQDTMDDLKRVGGTLFAHLGTELIPIFQNLADWVIEHMPEIKEFTSTAFDVISTAVKTLWGWFSDNLLPILKEIYKYIEENWPTFEENFKVVFDVISGVVETAWDWMKKFIEVAKTAYEEAEKTIKKIKEFFEWDQKQRERGTSTGYTNASMSGAYTNPLINRDITMPGDSGGGGGWGGATYNINNTVNAKTTVDADEMDNIMRNNSSRMAYELGL